MQFDGRCVFAVAPDGDGACFSLTFVQFEGPLLGVSYDRVYSIRPVQPVWPVHGAYLAQPVHCLDGRTPTSHSPGVKVDRRRDMPEQLMPSCTACTALQCCSGILSEIGLPNFLQRNMGDFCPSVHPCQVVKFRLLPQCTGPI